MLARRTKPARPGPRQQHAAGDSVPKSGGDQRGNGLDGIANSQISRSPDEIDRSEGERQLDSVSAFAVGPRLRRCLWFRLAETWHGLAGHDHGSASYANQLFIGQSCWTHAGQNLGGLVEEHKLNLSSNR